MKYVLYVIGAIAILFATMFLLNTLGLVEMKVFGVAKENVRREVFENTQSFVDGKRQELLRYKLQYELEQSPEGKQAIKYTILHSLVGLDETKLDPSLQAFLQEMRR